MSEKDEKRKRVMVIRLGVESPDGQEAFDEFEGVLDEILDEGLLQEALLERLQESSDVEVDVVDAGCHYAAQAWELEVADAREEALETIADLEIERDRLRAQVADLGLEPAESASAPTSDPLSILVVAQDEHIRGLERVLPEGEDRELALTSAREMRAVLALLAAQRVGTVHGTVHALDCDMDEDCNCSSTRVDADAVDEGAPCHDCGEIIYDGDRGADGLVCPMCVEKRDSEEGA